MILADEHGLLKGIQIPESWALRNEGAPTVIYITNASGSNAF